MMNRILLSRTLVSSLILFTAACSIDGKWALTSVEPSAARRDVQYQTLLLEKDGSFYGEATEDAIRVTSGTYTLQDGKLTLVEQGGVLHTYQGQVNDDGKLVLIECAQDTQAPKISIETTGIQTTSGTYTFKDSVLALVEHDGEQHMYPAKLTGGGKRLHIKQPWKNGRTLKAEYKRQE